MAVVSDKKLFIDNKWQATVLSAQDYYPFGMSMPNRKWQGSSTYRFDFNGKEKDPETELNDFGARFYAANIGRWLSIDPLAAKFPAWSPYNAMNNNPMFFIDPDGMASKTVEPTSAAAKKLYEDYKSKADEAEKSKLDKLEKSDVVYKINIKNLNMGKAGETNFDDISNNTVNLDIAPGEENQKVEALGDELEHARQFEDNDIGVRLC